jgi:hypothetical protein
MQLYTRQPLRRALNAYGAPQDDDGGDDDGNDDGNDDGDEGDDGDTGREKSPEEVEALLAALQEELSEARYVWCALYVVQRHLTPFRVAPCM